MIDCNIKRRWISRRHHPFLCVFWFSFVPWGLLGNLTRCCQHYSSQFVHHHLHLLIFSSSPLPFPLTSRCNCVRGWCCVKPFLFRRFRRLLKKSQEVTWANELNFGLSAPASVRQGRSGDEKGTPCFSSSAEKMARGKMWSSLLIRRQGGVSGLFECEMKNGETLSMFQTRVNTWSHTLPLSPSLPTHTHTSHKHRLLQSYARRSGCSCV